MLLMFKSWGKLEYCKGYFPYPMKNVWCLVAKLSFFIQVIIGIRKHLSLANIDIDKYQYLHQVAISVVERWVLKDINKKLIYAPTYPPSPPSPILSTRRLDVRNSTPVCYL